jgi:hypothetical protein
VKALKLDYLFWAIVILVLGALALQVVRSSRPPRPHLVWLYGSLIGIAAYLPAQWSFGPNAGWLGWGASVFVAIVAAPLLVIVDLTSPFWGYLFQSVGLLGLWTVVALTACLYHGSIAVWLGQIYRRRPWRALATLLGVLALHLVLFVLFQEHVIGRG